MNLNLIIVGKTTVFFFFKRESTIYIIFLSVKDLIDHFVVQQPSKVVDGKNFLAYPYVLSIIV